jgi:hypothetical protein
MLPAKPVGHFQLQLGFAVGTEATEAPKDCEAGNPIHNMLYKLLTFTEAEQTIDLCRNQFLGHFSWSWWSSPLRRSM